jgi:transcriptional regulator with XRE-family HTH domain
MRCDRNKLVQAREAEGLSPREMAGRAGVSRNVIDSMERGASVNDQSVQAVAAALGIVPNALQHPDEGREAAIRRR